MSKISPSQRKRPPKVVKGVPRWTVPALCVLLAGLVAFVFGGTMHNGFVNYDDPEYVFDNPIVSGGLTAQGVVWAFHNHCSNWHPITWISHMLDCQWFGLNPAGHHFTNVVLHGATVILLFLVLRQMTGFLWRNALVAALFAVHPQHVESVAWISERKDVLSGFFFVLTLGAYTRYVRSTPRAVFRYGLVALCFALGLMSKPMLVTLPFVLLLLDYWPLRRMTLSPGIAPGDGARFGALLWEKVPLFLIAALSCIATVVAQAGAIAKIDQLGLPVRIGNAIVSYVDYVRQMFWPTGLAVFYPHPAANLSFLGVLLALVLLAGVTLGVIFFRRRFPWLLVGWFWYLGMLAPVIGILQVGVQARADRYTYLPEIGLYLALAGMVSLVNVPFRRWVIGGVATIGIAALALMARAETAHWADAESLWRHALAHTEQNGIACANLGQALMDKGKVDDAIPYLKTAIKLAPSDFRSVDNLGAALLQKGEIRESIGLHEKAITINPRYEKAYNNLGYALIQAHRPGDAVSALKKAIELRPVYAKAENNLGNAYLQLNQMEEAIAHYQAAIRANPTFEKAHHNLGNALVRAKRSPEAISCFETALRLQPRYAAALNSFGWVLATSSDGSLRDGARALELARQAVQVSNAGSPVYLRTLAAAYAEAGRFSEASQTARQALRIIENQPESTLAQALQAQLQCYQNHTPWREQ